MAKYASPSRASSAAAAVSLSWRGRQWDVRWLNRKWDQVHAPKAGWVGFRWSRDVPAGARSFRVTRDRAGRWHVAFALIPAPLHGPGTGEAVGIDRGVAVSAALSTGETLTVPGLSSREQARLRRLQRRLARARRGSARRGKARTAVARLRARVTDRRRDWAEKTSTGIAAFDVIRVEDLEHREHDPVGEGNRGAARPQRRARRG